MCVLLTKKGKMHIFFKKIEEKFGNSEKVVPLHSHSEECS